ncbi:hypothetical protein O1611_g2403 [Lasiodiplodia mahajangana]|uniref:Uncharacterized protein n=1 Tax=Lasiodiplodia mahajangana TaxID=1108764 RepID=A0ACC2JUQ8_9PEZI|nr:hypothetical protein O1611_g2403 [Lasiodiplodia mahajangana]
MLFAEADAPLIKTWIVKRLENNSDADADVLADYVLALLRHDGDVETIRKLFEEEIPDFLREDAAAFTDDVLQAVKYRSYIPGAPPIPSVRQPHFPAPPALAHAAPRSNIIPPPASVYHPSAPFPTPSAPLPFSQPTSRKRAYSDHNDDDVDIILTSQPHKQPRRGERSSQRGGRYEDPYGPRSHRGPPAYSKTPGLLPFGAATLPFAPPPIDANSIIENIQILQSLLPPTMDLPGSIYPGATIPPPRRRKQRCRDYDARGYCSRGSNCHFEHGNEPPSFFPPIPSAVDGKPPLLDDPCARVLRANCDIEYDPNNSALSLPPFDVQKPPAGQQLDLPNFQPPAPINRRESKKPRRIKGRAPFAANGPNHDKTKKSIVVQNIPSENFTEDQVRGYFSQFGNIVEVSMQTQNRLAMIKFDSWEAANAAWSSPKVIFDNRFVKVFWYKEEGGSEATPNGKPKDATNGHVDGATPTEDMASAEPELDLEEFYRKQLAAQKVHDEKMKKRQEIERERQELEERQKELRERQAEAKRQLEAKLHANGSKDGSSSQAEASAESIGKKPNAQTEALRAQLAALEQEANQLGINPNDNHDDTPSWALRGRGRGRGYRGRGTFAPRALRGSYGYRGRGNTIETRHAAYAAYSLDNRPKIVALSGVDFTIPENDEALRQYLFSVGEFEVVHGASGATHITFQDRKTAEKFMFGVSASNSIHGIEGKIEPTWAKTAPESAKTADGDVVMTSTLGDEQAMKDKNDAGAGVANGELEEGEIDNTPDHDRGDMDYEAGEW